MSEDFLKNVTSHFIVRVWKRLLRVLQWEGVGDRIELRYIDLHSYGRQRCVFLVLQGCSTGAPGAKLSAGWWLSLLHLITNWSPKLHRGSRGPLRPGFLYHILLATSLDPNSIGGPEGHFGQVWLSLPHLVFNSNSNCLTSVLTELYNSSITHSIFGMACLIVIKRK